MSAENPSPLAPPPTPPRGTLRLYNTATRRKEAFEPLAPPAVTMYNCGPTVYDYFHVGNARNFVVIDAIRRHLEHRGHRVTFVQNFTDIDDKIIKRAAEKGEAWDALAARFTGAYFASADALGVRRADIHPLATEHIPQMLALIGRLIDKGLAYPTPGGDVYFRVRGFDGYGALSGKDVDDLREGARVETGDVKEDGLDFALWKGAKPGEPSWESPWGLGRPGWHIECSAMAMHHLGETIDIHSGGADLCFPHHENERAQSTGATGKLYARYWLHNGFLTTNNDKMSKSAGNFFTVDEVLKRWSAGAVRFYLLSAHYRNPLDYNPGSLDEAKAATGRIKEAVATAGKILGAAGGDGGATAGAVEPDAALAAAFDEALDDDFNTQGAIGVVFQAVSALNEARQAFSKSGAADTAAAARARGLLATIHAFLERLGLDTLLFAEEPADTGAGAAAGTNTATAGPPLADRLLDLLVKTRADAKKAKQFALADAIRDELAALGVRLQDHPTGTIWLKD